MTNIRSSGEGHKSTLDAKEKMSDKIAVGIVQARPVFMNLDDSVARNGEHARAVRAAKYFDKRLILTGGHAIHKSGVTPRGADEECRVRAL